MVYTVLQGANPNSRVNFQLMVKDDKHEPQTKLMDAVDAAELLAEWTAHFMEYQDVDIRDITFKLLQIDMPSGGTLSRRNEIIKADKSRCITQIVNEDTLCLTRAILVGISSYSQEKLEEIFKDNLTKNEIDGINYKRRKENYTKINEGIFSNIEVKYLSQTCKKLQTILANAFHRIYEIPIREYGNNLQDAHDIASKIGIQINIYSHDRSLIFSTEQKEIKVHLLITAGEKPHFDAITKITAFEPKIPQQACKWCHAKTACVKTKIKKCETCFKFFQNEQCLQNHKDNHKCIEYSFYCQKCKRHIVKRTMEEHKCNEYLCKGCNQYVLKPHNCFMAKTKLKQPSNKYVFF